MNDIKFILESACVVNVTCNLITKAIIALNVCRYEVITHMPTIYFGPKCVNCSSGPIEIVVSNEMFVLKVPDETNPQHLSHLIKTLHKAFGEGRQNCIYHI